ncbi:hypothetical protein AT2G03570 [Arabidopsis thaliana]|uniref:Uncharacterized protein At2g03570 n=1 Tax=Arabidopsis thaliana TaxID=3702 RepID=Q9ZPR9_ARATH|nr:uncharacterized protein AT2G03570 [Arabidopsis thaliana]AAD20065.1 unknown protein [Arabidopsis thaliana]AEC05716.1 hypothetical protein AT2G03570 [Arabidopsis thaliana]|eukprot:NP_178455.1 hypothetical protein AT2G03570 [Arabidopsis thaliana]
MRESKNQINPPLLKKKKATHLLKAVEEPVTEVVADIAREAVMNTEEVVVTRDIAEVTDLVEVVVEKDRVVVAVRDVAKEEVALEVTEEA